MILRTALQSAYVYVLIRSRPVVIRHPTWSLESSSHFVGFGAYDNTAQPSTIKHCGLVGCATIKATTTFGRHHRHNRSHWTKNEDADFRLPDRLPTSDSTRAAVILLGDTQPLGPDLLGHVLSSPDLPSLPDRPVPIVLVLSHEWI